MATVRWITPGSGLWTSTRNWSPALVPTAADDAVVTAVDPLFISLTTAAVRNLDISASDLVLGIGQSLTVGDTLTNGPGAATFQGVVHTGTFENAGLATVSYLTADAFINTGSVVLANGGLEIHSTYDTESLNRLGGTGGLTLGEYVNSAFVGGILVNTGKVFDLTDAPGVRIEALGTIVGGTVRGLSGTGYYDSLLSGVEWQGPLAITVGHMTLRNGSTLTGADGTGRASVALSDGSLSIEDGLSLQDAGIAMSGGSILTDGVLMLGSDVTLAAGYGGLGGNTLGGTGTIDTAGFINVQGMQDTKGSTYSSLSLGGENFINRGRILVYEQTASLGVGSAVFTNTAAATIDVAGGRLVVGSATEFINDGAINLNDGSISVRGILEGAGTITVRNGILDVSGAALADQSVAFVSKGTLELDQPVFFQSAIWTMDLGGVIRLAGNATGLGYANNELTVQGGDGKVFDLTVIGPYQLSNFLFTHDALGTAITVDIVAPLAPGLPDMTAGSDSGLSASDDITRITTPVFTGTAERGVRIDLYDGSTLIATTTAGNFGTWVAASTALGDGSHQITARAVDAVGNSSVASAALTVVIDTSAPAATTAPDLLAGWDSGGSSSDNITRDQVLRLAGMGEAGATVTLTRDGSPSIVVGTGMVDGTGHWNVDTSALAEGTHALRARLTDTAGNIGPGSAFLLVTVDLTPPPVPSAPDLASASDDGPSNSDNVTTVRAPQFAGTAEPGALVTLFDGTTAIGSANATNTGAWSMTATVLAPGTHAIAAQATDAAGNAGGRSATLSVTITDTPLVPTTPDLLDAADSGLSAADNVTSVTTPSFQGRGEAGAQVVLFDGKAEIGRGTVGPLGNWAVKTSALAEGAHAITARTLRAGGTLGDPSAALTVTIDTTQPVPPTVPDLMGTSDLGRSPTDNLTSERTPLIVGRAEANGRVTVFDGATVVGSGTVGQFGNWAVRTASLAQGVHSLTARVTDLAGNVSGLSASLSITVDIEAPGAPSVPDLVPASDTGSWANDNLTNDLTPSFQGRGEPGARVTLYDGDDAVGSGITGPLGNWAITTVSLAQGVHRISARATDAAGNTGPASAPIDVTIDSTAPLPPSLPDLTPDSDTGADRTDNITTDNTPTFTGRAEGGARVTVFADDVVVGSGTVGPLGNWAVTTSVLAVGDHLITAQVTDVAGNAGYWSPALVVVTEAPPPPGLASASTAGGGTDTVLASIGYRLPTGSEIEFLTAASGKGLLLAGNETSNTITGGAGDDTIEGGGGADILIGGAGADLFAFMKPSDTPAVAGGSDTIMDFGPGDAIGLSTIDANDLIGGDQAFAFIGAAGFSGSGGELRAEVMGAMTVVSGDTNGDRLADFAIRLAGAPVLGADSFRL